MYLLSEARQVNEMARGIFSKDGYHRPIMLLFKQGSKGYDVLDIAPMMVDDRGKNFMASMVRRMAIEQKITGVAIITEAWMAQLDKNDKNLEEMTKKINRGEISVSKMDTKKEVLMVRIESDDGLDVTFMNEIFRDLDGTPTLMQVQELKGCGGRLGGFFAPMPDNSRN